MGLEAPAFLCLESTAAITAVAAAKVGSLGSV